MPAEAYFSLGRVLRCILREVIVQTDDCMYGKKMKTAEPGRYWEGRANQPEK
jgi:hypothetical protein